MPEESCPVTLAVVGAGGLGIPASWAAARAWAPTAKLRLTIVEPDSVELSNLNRQILYRREDVGKQKAPVLISALRKLTARNVELFPVESLLDRQNIEQVLGPADLVIDATDSPRTKFLINDFCVAWAKPFCYGGVTAWDGQLLAYRPGGGCLRCLFGDLSAEEIDAQNRSCQSAGIIGAAAGSVGSLQGAAAVNFLSRGTFWEGLSEPHSLFVRIGPSGVKKTTLPPDPACPLGCSGRLKRLDLTSKCCPETFLYSKLAMEEVPFGCALEVKFSDPESLKRVGASLTEEGFRTVALTEGRVLVSKRGPNR